MRLLTFFLCLFAASFLSAQAEASIDGPALAYRATESTQPLTKYQSRGRDRTLLGDLDLSGLWGGPTYNYSMTGDDWALVRGGFGGLEFGNEFFLGYGGWKGREDFTTEDGNSNRYNFRHSGLILAYSPLSHKPIHPRFTAIFGPGRVEIGSFDDRFLVGQAMAGLELNLFQWFRIGLEGGYRFASGVDLSIVDIPVVSDQDVSGAIFQIEARFGFSN